MLGLLAWLGVASWILMELLLLLGGISALILLGILVLLRWIVALIGWLLLEVVGATSELLLLRRVPSVVVSGLVVLVLIEVVVTLLLHEGLADGVEGVACVGWATLMLRILRVFDLHWFVSLSLSHWNSIDFAVIFVEFLEFD